MDLAEFSWHPALNLRPGESGMDAKRGGPNGTTFGAVTWHGDGWHAVLNLHTPHVRSIPCDSEAEAIQAVENWLEGLAED